MKLKGTSGNDVLIGGARHDSLSGKNGDDKRADGGGEPGPNGRP